MTKTVYPHPFLAYTNPHGACLACGHPRGDRLHETFPAPDPDERAKRIWLTLLWAAGIIFAGVYLYGILCVLRSWGYI